MTESTETPCTSCSTKTCILRVITWVLAHHDDYAVDGERHGRNRGGGIADLYAWHHRCVRVPTVLGSATDGLIAAHPLPR